MTTEWRYTKDNQQHGPVSAATLKQLAESGQLGPDDLVCQEGSEQWVAASRLKGLFGPTQPPPPAPQVSVAESLPKIDVGKAVKGVADTVQGVVQSEPVQSAAASIKNAAGQASEGVGRFIRSDAVQSQVKTANSFWSSLTTQHKLLAAGVGGLGLLMMSCCFCGFLGALGQQHRQKDDTASSSQAVATESSNHHVASESDDDGSPKVYSVSKGAFKGSISIEVAYELMSLSSIKYVSRGPHSTQISFRMTLASLEGATFRHREDSYRFTAYDKDGVTLKSGLITHEAIGPGETVLGTIRLSVPGTTRIVIN